MAFSSAGGKEAGDRWADSVALVFQFFLIC